MGIAETPPKHGARIYPLGDEVCLVKQTIKKGADQNAPYVIDGPTDNHRERHVELADDAAIAQAVRDALAGQL